MIAEEAAAMWTWRKTEMCMKNKTVRALHNEKCDITRLGLPT